MKTKFITLSIALSTLVLSSAISQNEVFPQSNTTADAEPVSVHQQPESTSQNTRLAAANLINYQAVARDAGGNLIVSTPVTVAFEIRDGAGGLAVFTESHNPTTDENGVFSIQLGSVNSLAAVNWLDIDAWLQVSLNGTNVGETQMGSVPSALHSTNSGQVILYGSGTTNTEKMIAQHSPAFPDWGIQYADIGDDVNFIAGGSVNASVDLATGDITTDGDITITTTTGSPAVNTIYGNSVPIAYGSIDSLGGISTGYGIASVNNSATGVYQITMDLDSNPANTIVSITPFTIGFGTPEIAGYETTGANTFTVRIQDASGTARDSAFAFVVYGNF